MGLQLYGSGYWSARYNLCTIDFDCLAVSSSSGFVLGTAGIVSNVARLQTGNGQHGTELVNIDDFDASLIGARVVGERSPVPAPLEANRSVALGHRAGQSQTLALLQVPGTHERNDFRPNYDFKFS